RRLSLLRRGSSTLRVRTSQAIKSDSRTSSLSIAQTCDRVNRKVSGGHDLTGRAARTGRLPKALIRHGGAIVENARCSRTSDSELLVVAVQWPALRIAVALESRDHVYERTNLSVCAITGTSRRMNNTPGISGNKQTGFEANRHE